LEKVFITRRNIIHKFFPVHEPYGYSAISFNPLTRQYRYEVVEPTMSDGEKETYGQVETYLRETINTTMAELGSRDEAVNFLKDSMGEMKLPDLSEGSREKILYYLIRDYLDYGKMDVMMRDQMIEDVSCNGAEVPFFIWHRTYESIPSNLAFGGDEELDTYVIRLAYKARRMISVANPLLDASLPDGSRIQLTYGKYVTKQGSTFTIRKFKAEALTIVDLIRNSTISPEIAALLWYIVENRHSVFVCGAIASGKTTMLNCLSQFIEPDAKVVTIEDTPEVQIYHKNWIRAVTRPKTGSSEEITLFDLLRAALRQRPDYIIVGEVRGEEAYTLFQAMSTGHLGLATLHAENVAPALRRLETEPMNIPRMMVAGLNMVIMMARREINGEPTRRVTTCAEVKGLTPNGDIDWDTLINWDPKEDTWHLLGESHYLMKAATERRGISVEEAKNDIRMRAEILSFLANSGRRSFAEVTQVIRDYVRTPESVHEALLGSGGRID
jgi:flagellar protein FlaI